jgi:hypothetical protein
MHEMVGEHRSGRRVERDEPAARCRLRRADVDPTVDHANGTPHRDLGTGEIDVDALQAEHLTATHPGGRQHHERRV